MTQDNTREALAAALKELHAAAVEVKAGLDAVPPADRPVCRLSVKLTWPLSTAQMALKDYEATTAPLERAPYITDDQVVEWADGLLQKTAFNRPVAIQIATKAAQWVRDQYEPSLNGLADALRKEIELPIFMGEPLAAIRHPAPREPTENGGKTGSPPGLLQDDCKGLSQWLASRPDALRRVREACIEIEAQQRAEAGIKEKP